MVLALVLAGACMPWWTHRRTWGHGCLPIDFRQNGDLISVYVLNGLNLYCYGVAKINAHVYVSVSIHRQAVCMAKKKRKKRSREKHMDEESNWRNRKRHVRAWAEVTLQYLLIIKYLDPSLWSHCRARTAFSSVVSLGLVQKHKPSTNH